MSCGKCETCSCENKDLYKNIQVISEISEGTIIGAREIPIKRIEVQDDKTISVIVDSR